MNYWQQVMMMMLLLHFVGAMIGIAAKLSRRSKENK
jgi:hypothetical protein